MPDHELQQHYYGDNYNYLKLVYEEIGRTITPLYKKYSIFDGHPNTNSFYCWTSNHKRLGGEHPSIDTHIKYAELINKILFERSTNIK
jgi:hypothetical protein